MFLNIKIIMLVFLQHVAVGSSFQKSIDGYSIISKDGCLVLIRNKTDLDTLCSKSFNGDGIKRNLILDYDNNAAIRIQLKSRGIDDFSSFSYLVERWEVKNARFNLESSLEIPLGNCYSKKLKIKLTNDGVKWKYKRGFFRKSLKGLIPYSKLKKSKEYHLPCK